MCVSGTITVKTVGEISIEYYLPWAGFLIDKITGIFCQQIQHKAHANIM